MVHHLLNILGNFSCLFALWRSNRGCFHLGVEYDYFGIGEFWDCKSVENNFGIQTRFYAYKGASLTGAVAIKAGASIVTITTQVRSLPGDLPTLR